MSPLDRSLAVTFFKSQFARSKTEESISLRELAARIRETRAARKIKLPWLKLARFGDKLSEKNCIRYDANLIATTGLELDNDGGPWTIDDAADFFETHGIESLLYESPSADKKPRRWRALLPFSREMGREERRALVEKLGALIPGLDMQVSRGLSTAFLFGAEGDWTPRTIQIDGRPVDRVRLPDGGADKPRDESRSGRHFAACLDSVRKGLTYEDHLDSLDDELRGYADEARGQGTKGERDWQRAVEQVDRDDSNVRDSFDDEDDEPKAKRRATLEIYWGDEDDGTGDLESLVAGVLHKKTLASIYGPYGAGKSFVALDLALCIATGKAWFGNDVERGAVLYVAPEGFLGLKRRRAAWLKHHKRKRTPDNFALVRGSLNLQKPDKVTIETLAAAALKRKAVLIVIDTLNASFGGADENDSAAMSKARDELKRLCELSGATVLVIHHAGKDVSRGLRGSSVLGGALDTVLLVNDGRIIARAPQGKQKDLEAGDDIGFALQSVDLDAGPKGESIASAVVIPAVCEAFPDDSLTEREKDALSVLRGLNNMEGAATRKALSAALRKRKWASDLKGGAFRKALKDVIDGLTSKTMIEQDSNDAYLCILH